MKNKKGISLIVLVITIIVMVILAGAIIITLNNSGIIQKTSEAVDKTNEATVKEVATLGWAEAYAKYGANEEKLKEGVNNTLIKNNINPEEYNIVVTTSGVKIKLLADMWIKNGFTVVRGNDVLEIGDTIEYTATGTTYNSGWRVLGADAEGNLLIMSMANVTRKKLGDDSNLLQTQQSWLDGPELLDAECEAYGRGIGVVGKARSITVEDVNSITGYNPLIAAYAKGEIHEYGNEVTYTWDTTDASNIKIKTSGTLNSKTDSTNYLWDIFTWYDEKTGKFPSVDKGATTLPLPTIKGTRYSYYAPELTTINKQSHTKIYTMLFGDNNASYWLASLCVASANYGTVYGLRSIGSGYVDYCSLWVTTGGFNSNELGVRAVITLSSDITLTGSSETGWTYTVN